MTRLRTAVALAAALVIVTRAGPELQWRARVEAQSSAVSGQHWQVQVDNVSLADHVWSFNAYYPDHLQAHPGDLITFTVAKNPNAFHTVELLAPTLLPSQGYPGFAFRDDDDTPPALAAVFFNSKPFFGASPSTLCGRAGNTACVFDGSGTTALKSGVLVNPPPDGMGQGNPTFTLQLDAKTRAGTYFFVCLVHGPSMSGSIDVVESQLPVQDLAALRADADRSYAADLARLTEAARSIQTPEMVTNPDGSRAWKTAAGGGSPDNRLAVDEFGAHDLMIRPGDVVTWINRSPPVVAHTVTGFAGAAGQPIARMEPYQPVCGGPDADQGGESGPDTVPAPGSYPPDVWNNCPPWQQEDHITNYAYPSTPSGSTFKGADMTSGMLLSEAFLSSSIGAGLPFASSYSIVFPTAGTYRYACMIHYGMIATIEVVPTPTPTGEAGSNITTEDGSVTLGRGA